LGRASRRREGGSGSDLAIQFLRGQLVGQEFRTTKTVIRMSPEEEGASVSKTGREKKC
jgi:hypothetical protein